MGLFPMPLTSLRLFKETDLNPNEMIIYKTRMHPISFVVGSINPLVQIAVGLLIIATAYLYRDVIGFMDDRLNTFGIILFAGIFLLWGFYQLVMEIIDFVFDQYIVTNQRVIVENQDSLFSEGIVTANMRSVEEVNLTQKGFLRTVFDFGMLEVKTAARTDEIREGENLILTDIPKPKKVQRLIDEIAYRVKREVEIVPEEVLKACGLMN